jgi:hypothetical protein
VRTMKRTREATATKVHFAGSRPTLRLVDARRVSGPPASQPIVLAPLPASNRTSRAKAMVPSLALGAVGLTALLALGVRGILVAAATILPALVVGLAILLGGRKQPTEGAIPELRCHERFRR